MSDKYRSILGIAILVIIPLLVVALALPVLLSIIWHFLVAILLLAILTLACALLLAPLGFGGHYVQKWYRSVFFRESQPPTNP